MKFKILLATTVALTLIMYGCGDSDKKDSVIEGSHNYENKSFTIKVDVYDDVRALNKALKAETKKDSNVSGSAYWLITEDLVIQSCTLSLVRPKGKDDTDEFKVWGHELAHCVYGTFHAE